jgi:hypothetical protein
VTANCLCVFSAVLVRTLTFFTTDVELSLLLVFCPHLFTFNFRKSFSASVSIWPFPLFYCLLIRIQDPFSCSCNHIPQVPQPSPSIFTIGLRHKIKDDGMERACSTHGEKTSACRWLVGYSEDGWSLGRPRF